MPPSGQGTVLPSQPGDPPGSWRDAFGNLRAADGRPMNEDGSIATGSNSKGLGGGSNGGNQQPNLTAQVTNQSAQAAKFATVGEEGYGAMTAESAMARERMRQLAEGQDSLSREQLRQALGQQLSMQRSMAAGASPQNSAMAARTAATQMGRANAGMSGQAALAGIQERAAAQNALNQMIIQQRQQDATVALGSRQNAIGGYTGATPDKDVIEKYGPALAGGLAAGATMSDERVKKNIKGADSEANKAIQGLRAYTFKYKDQKHGKGKQVGVMAQELERAGLKHAVFETPEGKAVHGGKLATANTAMIAALGRRLAKLEGRRK